MPDTEISWLRAASSMRAPRPSFPCPGQKQVHILLSAYLSQPPVTLRRPSESFLTLQ